MDNHPEWEKSPILQDDYLLMLRKCTDDLKENIFDPFVTNKINGKGLGLSICAKIIQNHSGTIEFDTINNRTIFTVMFDKINK